MSCNWDSKTLGTVPIKRGMSRHVFVCCKERIAKRVSHGISSSKTESSKQSCASGTVDSGVVLLLLLLLFVHVVVVSVEDLEFSS